MNLEMGLMLIFGFFLIIFGLTNLYKKMRIYQEFTKLYTTKAFWGEIFGDCAYFIVHVIGPVLLGFILIITAIGISNYS